eukprot:5611875-Pleurochrysis_carterae.AAC.2
MSYELGVCFQYPAPSSFAENVSDAAESPLPSSIVSTAMSNAPCVALSSRPACVVAPSSGAGAALPSIASAAVPSALSSTRSALLLRLGTHDSSAGRRSTCSARAARSKMDW